MLQSIEVYATDIRDTEDYGIPPTPLRYITFPVTKPDPSVPYIVRDVQGLGPVKADVNTSTYSNWDGGIYQNHKIGERNILFKIHYRPDYSNNQTVQDLRRSLYQYLSPGVELELRFVTGPNPDDVFRIKGVVESMEPNIFAKDPEVQVSIMCPDSYFKAPKWETIMGKTGTRLDIPNRGTAPAGFTIFMTGHSSLTGVTVANASDPPLVWVGAISPSFQLQVATERGGKHLSVMNRTTEVVTSRLDGITEGSLAMTIGRNSGTVWVTTKGVTGLPFALNYTPKYVGI